MSNLRRVTIVAALTLLGCSTPPDAPLLEEVGYEEAQPAQAELRDEQFKVLGQAEFTETDAGLQVSVAVAAAPEGEYRAQLHEFGSCEGPGFLSAGKPFFGSPDNPGAEPVFKVTAAGTGHVEFVVPDLAISDVLRPGGATVILERLSGEGYGERFACGLIARIPDEPISAENLTPGGLSSGNDADNLGTGDGKVHRRPGDEATSRP